MAAVERGFIFANLVDFDTQYGHRNDVDGLRRETSSGSTHGSPALLPLLRDDDLLVITADHGNDPTTPSTDHAREYVPLMVTGGHVRRGADLGIRRTFADLGPDDRGDCSASAASPTASASCSEICGLSQRRMTIRPTISSRSASARSSRRRRPRAPSRAVVCAPSRKTMCGRLFSATATASSTARRSAGSSTRRRCSSRRPAITTAPG